MKIRFRPEARREAIESARYFGKQTPVLGAEFNRLVHSVINNAAEHPHRGRRMGRDDLRAAEIDRFHYRVYYQILDDEILILSVASTLRSPEHWRDRAG